MTHGLFSGTDRGGDEICRENTFKRGTGAKILPVPAGIQDTDFAFQMTLLTDTIAGDGRQLARIDNRAWDGVLQMCLSGAVAAFTGDGRESRLTELIVSAGNEIRGI
jgi:hypothetical protein